MAGDQPNRSVKSVGRTCEIIEALRQHGGLTISELDDHVDLTPGTIHTHLTTLRSHGFVMKEEEAYRLGYRLLTLGEHVRNHTELYRTGKAQADTLADETGESAHLITESEGMEVVLYESFGEKAVGTEFYIRNREDPKRYLHCTAAGKAILAHLPDERVAEIADQTGLARVTQNTITDPDELFDELERIRNRGHATNDEEQVTGLRAVAAPVLRENGEVCGAISLSAPVTRLDAERFTETYPNRVTSAANIIEVNIHITGNTA